MSLLLTKTKSIVRSNWFWSLGSVRLSSWPDVHWAPDTEKSRRVDLNTLTKEEVASWKPGQTLLLNGKMLTGKVGAEVSTDEAQRRARLIGLQLLSAARTALGSLDRVDQVVKMLCMTNAVPDYKEHPKVADGMSNLFVEVFGENGRHARSSVGMGSLPNQISVEIEGVFSIKP